MAEYYCCYLAPLSECATKEVAGKGWQHHSKLMNSKSRFLNLDYPWSHTCGRQQNVMYCNPGQFLNRSIEVNTVLGYNSDDRQLILDRGRKGSWSEMQTLHHIRTNPLVFLKPKLSV